MTDRESELANRFALAHFGRTFVGLNDINRAFCRNCVRDYLQLNYPIMG